jgi:DNA polymerase V
VHVSPYAFDVGSLSINYPVSRLSCGFPSPADDFLESPLTLSQLLLKNPNATFFVKASGSSMEGKGILDGAILTVDRSRKPVDGCIVVAAIDGELTCKIIDTKNNQLLSANAEYAPIPITDAMDVVIQGVVTFAINTL